MIDKNELRDGNFVEYNGRMFIITSTEDDFCRLRDYLDERDFGSSTYADIKGIELNERVLKKLGFEYDEILNSFRLGDFEFRMEDMEHLLHKNSDFPMPCEYVHQFQNIYFDLTGKQIL